MKKNFKLMTAVLAMTALASCTDDLSINGSQKGLYGKDDLVATLKTNDVRTRFAVQEESDKVKGGQKALVWSSNDQIRIFTLDKLSQDLYEIKSGAGGGTAVFQRIADSGLTGDKYAITEATSIYGISATNVDGKDLPLLTVTLPGKYTVGDDSEGNKNFPVPYWGAASVTGSDEDTYINASFTGLAAFLRVSLNELPADTRAIVLTTHGDRTGNHPTEGFQIAKTAPTKDSQDATDGWGNTTNFPYTTGGKSEAISGTLNAVLDPSQNPDDVFLKVDDRLVKSDTLRVNLVDEDGNYIYDPATENQIFYIPIVVGQYENLHVLAVTGDSKYSYTWVGEELHNFRNQEFENNTAYYLDLNIKSFAEADLNTLNAYINSINGTAAMNTVINVEELVDADIETDDADFATDELDITGAGNLVINFKKISSTTLGASDAAPLLINEGETEIAAAETPTLELNFPDDWSDKFVSVETTLRKTILGTVDGENSEITATVLGSADKYVMSYDIYENVEQYRYMVQKNSAVTIKNGFKKVTVADGTVGDIYVYTDGAETEVGALEVLSTANNNIRISSALVKDIRIADVADGEREIWTDGSAAMQTVKNVDETGYPKNTHTYSYYTGAGLSDYAWQNGYDQEEIYTAAQLQSMGAKKRVIDGNEVNNQKTDGKYKIPNAFVASIWLGSKDYPWIGPEVTIDDFSFDGETTALRNMKVDVDGTSSTIYIDDPHYCCTSCGLPGTESTLAITDDLGLIRSIVGTTAATVKNVNLNDVLIATDNKINNIGAIVGRVAIDGKDFTFENNVLGEVKIDVNGDNVGGMIGSLSANAITLKNNNNTSTAAGKTGGYVKSDKGYVGGLVGSAVAADAVTLENNKVALKDNVEAGEGYAAGLIGSLEATKAVTATNNTVNVKDITAAGSYAAGAIAYLKSDDKAVFTGTNVKACNIASGNLYAGGLIGQSESTGTALNNSTVEITTALAAENGQLGGLIGNAAKGDVTVNTTDTKNQNTTITIAKLQGGYAAGGILGSNNTGVALTVTTNHGGTGLSAWTNQVNVTASAYESTKSASDYTFAEAYKYGTMQDVIGYKQGNVTILNDRLTVSGALTDDAKKAVHYDAHLDTAHTSLAEELYWGDNNGYVGFGYTGNYTLNNATVPSEVEGGYNYFKAY